MTAMELALKSSGLIEPAKVVEDVDFEAESYKCVFGEVQSTEKLQELNDSIDPINWPESTKYVEIHSYESFTYLGYTFKQPSKEVVVSAPVSFIKPNQLAYLIERAKSEGILGSVAFKLSSTGVIQVKLYA